MLVESPAPPRCDAPDDDHDDDGDDDDAVEEDNDAGGVASGVMAGVAGLERFSRVDRIEGSEALRLGLPSVRRRSAGDSNRCEPALGLELLLRLPRISFGALISKPQPLDK